MSQIKDLRMAAGMTQKAFSEYFGISKRAVESWEGGQRECPDYLISLIKYKLEHENKIAPNYTNTGTEEQHMTAERNTLMEIYYVYGGTSNTIIIATDGTKAVELDEINPDELGGPDPLTNDEVLYIINHRLSNDSFYQAYWNEFFQDAFFPAAEIPTRYPDAIKYSP